MEQFTSPPKKKFHPCFDWVLKQIQIITFCVCVLPHMVSMTYKNNKNTKSNIKAMAGEAFL